MTSELCQDVVAASEKSSNLSLTSEKAAWEALRAGEGGGGGEEKKGIPFSNTRSFTTIRNPSPVYQKG